MSKFKNIPGLVWLAIGVLVTLLVVPSTAYAAALKFTGIEGTSTNKADVTPAGQLLTTEASPTTYESYDANGNEVSSFAAGQACQAVSPILPAGESYIVQDISAAIQTSNVQVVTGTTNSENSQVAFVVAQPSANFCTTVSGYTPIGIAVAPAGNTGTVDLPQRPGFVIPNGYQIYALAGGTASFVTTNGYLIPSSDAPSAPAVQSQGHRMAGLLQRP
jgi:hypothetical protein